MSSSTQRFSLENETEFKKFLTAQLLSTPKEEKSGEYKWVKKYIQSEPEQSIFANSATTFKNKNSTEVCEAFRLFAQEIYQYEQGFSEIIPHERDPREVELYGVSRHVLLSGMDLFIDNFLNGVTQSDREDEKINAMLLQVVKDATELAKEPKSTTKALNLVKSITTMQKLTGFGSLASRSPTVLKLMGALFILGGIALVGIGIASLTHGNLAGMAIAFGAAVWMFGIAAGTLTAAHTQDREIAKEYSGVKNVASSFQRMVPTNEKKSPSEIELAPVKLTTTKQSIFKHPASNNDQFPKSPDEKMLSKKLRKQ